MEREQLSSARSFLFVPGSRADRFDKAWSAGADIVIVDLEDAVPPDEKRAARTALSEWLSAERPVLIRINDVDSPWFDADLKILNRPGVIGAMVPKARASAGLDRVGMICPVVALVESAKGITTAGAIAATGNVVRLAFGTIDMALDLGLRDENMLASLGLDLVLASRTAGLAPPIDGVTQALKDLGRVEADMRTAHARGFSAKLCIHPVQIPAVHRALAPTPEEIVQAERVTASDKEAGGAAFALDGKMIDRPVVERAYRTLRDAALFGGLQK